MDRHPNGGSFATHMTHSDPIAEAHAERIANKHPTISSEAAAFAVGTARGLPSVPPLLIEWLALWMGQLSSFGQFAFSERFRTVPDLKGSSERGRAGIPVTGLELSALILKSQFLEGHSALPLFRAPNEVSLM